MRLHYRVTFSCFLAASICAFSGATDKSVQSLQSVLNKADYSLVSPARSDVIPGGFIVANKKHASYNDLPSGVTFKPEDFSASVYSSTSSGSFSLSALVNGIAKMVGGGVSVSRDSQLTVKQIDASAQKVDPQVVIANPNVQTQLTKWLSDKKANYRVYMVVVALSTTSISVTSSGNTDVAAAFGASLPTCPTDSSTGSQAEQNSGTTAGTGSGSDATSGAAPKPSSSPTAKGASPASGNTTSTTTLNTSSPNGTLKACANSKSQIGLSTKMPLVFGTSLREVTLNSDGSLSVSPVSDVENTKAGVHVIPLPSDIDWNPKHAKPGFVGSGQ